MFNKKEIEFLYKEIKEDLSDYDERIADVISRMARYGNELYELQEKQRACNGIYESLKSVLEPEDD